MWWYSGYREPTDEEHLAYLRWAWRGAYVIVRPGKTENVWRALATWGNGDELVSDSPDGLLYLIRRHYPGLIDRPVARSQT